MSLKLEGLTELQRDLLNVALEDLPKKTPQLMRKVGSKARTNVARKARQLVKKKTGYYHKRWKRGKVFIGHEGEWVVRVFNSSPHAHLLEYGHRIVDKNGNEIGFSRGRYPLAKGMDDFENSNQMEVEVVKWLDKLLKDGNL